MQYNNSIYVFLVLTNPQLCKEIIDYMKVKPSKLYKDNGHVMFFFAT